MRIRPVLALDPRSFGRRLPCPAPAPREIPRVGNDLRLFGSTFAAGFLFVSILIA